MASFPPVFADFFGGWELVMVFAIAMVLFGLRRFPELLNGLRRGMTEFIKATHDVTEEIRGATNLPTARSDQPAGESKARKDEFSLWIAQGFDIGRIPIAPGTFGSLLGVLWFALLLVPGSLWLFVVGTLIGLAASVKYCGEAERILGQSDPGSVVLDEISAIPICFLPWVLVEFWRQEAMPPPEIFLVGHGLWITASIFVSFRVFDIWKPWPVRQSQNLPGGWGVTADDVLAAIYVAALSLLFMH